MNNVVENRVKKDTDRSLTLTVYNNEERVESVKANTFADEQKDSTPVLNDLRNELFKPRLRASCGIY